MAFAPAGGEAALGAWTLVAFLGFVVCFGLLQAWRHTIGAVFRSIADKKIGLRYVGSIKPLAFLGTIDNSVESNLAAWASGFQKQYGLAMHYMAALAEVMSKEIAQLSQDSLAASHYFERTAIPAAINTALRPWRSKTNKASVAAAAALAAAAVAKKASQSHAHTEAGSTATTKAEASSAAKTVAHTSTVVKTVERTVVHDTKVITQVIDVASIPIPFGRTISNIKRRLSRAETWVGATALSIAMANVLGIPNPRCLRDGPLGRISRRLCGIPTNFLNDLLGLVADFFILENICTVLPWLESAASEIGTPLVELLTDVGAGLCKGSSAPAALSGPMPSVPALIFGISASGV